MKKDRFPEKHDKILSYKEKVIGTAYGMCCYNKEGNMKHRICMLNIARINYDHRLDISCIKGDVVAYEDSDLQEILQRVQDCKIVVSKELGLSKALIEQFPDSVRLICEAGTGYNNIDLEACRKKGIIVCNTPAYSTKRVAHTAIMLLLSLSSSMREQLQMLEHKDYRNFTDHMLVEHTEVNDKTLGVIGYGSIGQEVIRIAKVLDMKILVYTRTPREHVEGVRFVSLPELLKESDYVSLHCPLTSETRHLIDEVHLSMMKPSAAIINTARGALIDEQALIAALQNKRIAKAALDVQEEEPMREDNPLYTMPNVIITPHMGWRGLETRQRLLQLVSANIEAYMEGTVINRVV